MKDQICKELGIDPKNPEHAYHLFNTVTMVAGPVRSWNALQGSKAILDRGWTTPDKILAVPYWDKVKVLNKNHFARFDESRARFFEHNAKLLKEKYDGDVHKLIGSAKNKDDLKEKLQEFLGYGPVAANIFLHEIKPHVKIAGLIEDVIAQGYKVIESQLPSVQNSPVELAKYKNMTSPEVWNMIAGKHMQKIAGEFSCVLVKFNPSLLKDIQAKINAQDLYTAEAGHGFEDEPHVTVLYGLHTQDASTVENLVKSSNIRSFNIKIGTLSLFQNEKFDVLKFEVSSPQLSKLNTLLRTLPHTNKYTDYKPHITVAYLKPGTGKKYLSLGDLTGKEIKAFTYTFSTPDREHTEFVLQNNGAVMNHLKNKIAMIKEALRIERQQKPEILQKERQPSAIIIQGNQDYIRGNPIAKKFYNDIAQFIREKGYTVAQTKGDVSGKPPGANLWVSHGGINPPKGTKVLNIPHYPRPFMTRSLIQALDRVTTQK